MFKRSYNNFTQNMVSGNRGAEKFRSRQVLFWISFILGISNLLAQKELVISGGNSVSSLVCANRKVYVWGNNAGGQLGVTGGTIVSTPTALPGTYFGGKDVQQVNSGSGAHFVALDCNGGVWSWGQNTFGQVGNGTSGNVITVPVQVLAPTALKSNTKYSSDGVHLTGGVDVVYAGNANSFAILDDGRLISWGSNGAGNASPYDDAFGQLGQGTVPASGSSVVSTPNFVITPNGQPLQPVSQIFVGDNSAYALVNGTVYSWGNGQYGTLGRNAAGTANPASSATVRDGYARPVLKADGTPLNNITAISAGDVFGIALDADGYVWTWGNGGWNNATGNSTSNYSGSDPRKVLKGTTTGASNDGTYLLAKAIGGGQGFGMAVTADGKPVAWGGGGCGDGGTTGNGTVTGSSKTGVGYIMYAAGSVHSNVTMINRGDTWGFYGTANNEFYTWGCNSNGQLGIGNTVDQAYATKISPPTGCGFRDPFPTVKLTPSDTSVCQLDFEPAGILLKSNFVPATTLDKAYQVTWYKDDVLVKGNPSSTTVTEAGVSVNGTYQATKNGKYKVVIKYIGANGGCVEYPIVADSMTITYFPKTFDVPTNLTYCGDTVKPSVIPNSFAKASAVYKYYTSATSTTPIVDTTIGAASGSFLLSKFPGITKDADGTVHVFVEETGYISGMVDLNDCGAQTYTGIEQDPQYQTQYTAYEPLVLTQTALSFRINMWSPGTLSTSVSFKVYGATTNTNGGLIPDQTKVLGTVTVPVTATRATSADPQTIFINTLVNMNVAIPGTSNGYVFFISPVKGTQPSSGQVEWGYSACTTIPINDNIAGAELLTQTGMAQNFQNAQIGSSIKGGMFYDLKFSGSQKYCNRSEITIKLQCPCNKPKSVSITAPTASQVFICEGTALNLKGTYVDGGKTVVSGIKYVWYKLPTSPTSISYAAVPVVDKTIATTVAATDSGKWVLRVEDGTAGLNTCYTEDTVHVRIDNVVKKQKIAANQTICYNTDANAINAPTGSGGRVGSTVKYLWYKGTKAGVYTKISPVVTTEDYDPAEKLVDTVYYFRKDSSGVCATVNTDTVKVSVLKKVDAGTVDGDTTICINTAVNVFRETVKPSGGTGAYTYQWLQATASNGPFSTIASATSATYTPPSNLTQDTYYSRIVSSTITGPPAVTCTTDTTNVLLVAVISKNNPGTIGTDQSTCSGVAPSTLTSITAASGSSTPQYQWVSKLPTDKNWSLISGATNATYAPAALTATTMYRRIAKTGLGTCNLDTTKAVTVTVYSVVDPGTIGRDTTVCSGNAPSEFKSITAVSGGNATYSYQWIGATTAAGPYLAIPSATAEKYSAPAQTVTAKTTVYLKREVTSGNCPKVTTSSPIALTFLPVVNPGAVGSDQSICPSSVPAAFTQTTAASGGDGTFTYQWQKSTTSATAGFADISGATSATFTPVDAESANVFFRRTVSSSTCTAASTTAIKITMLNGVNAGVIAGGEDLCANVALTNGNITSTSLATGGAGTPVYSWQSSTDKGTTWSTVTGSNSTYTVTGTLTDTVWYKRVVSTGSGTCDKGESNIVKFNVYEVITPGVLTADQTICYNNDPAAFAVSTAPKGGNGTYTYNWFEKVGSGAWTAVAASGLSTDKSTFDPGKLTQTTAYKRVVSSGNCTAVDETILTVTVNPALTAGSIGTDQTICKNTAPALLTELTSATGGGTSTYTYEWISKSGTAAYAAIPSTDATTYQPGSLSTETIYRRITKFGTCTPDTSNEVKISILAGIEPGTIGDNQEICYNSTPIKIQNKVAASGALTTDVANYTWEATLDTTVATSWVDLGVPASTTADYTPVTALTQTIFVRRKVTKGTSSCNTAYTKPLTIKVYAQQTAGAIAADQSICENATMAALTETTAASGGNTAANAYTYKWLSATSSSGPWTELSGEKNTTLSARSQASTIFYKRTVESKSPTTNTVCSVESSNAVKITVTPNVTVDVKLDNGVVCKNQPIVYTATPTNGGTSPVYKWYIKGVLQPENTNTITRTGLDSAAIVKVELISDITCTVQANKTDSDQIETNIVSLFTPSISLATPDTSCVGSSVSVKIDKVKTGGTSTYEWFLNNSSTPVLTSTTDSPYTSSTFQNGDEVTVKVTSSLACAVPKFATSAPVKLVVYDVPTPQIKEGDMSICAGTSYLYTLHNTKGTIVWYKDGVLIQNTKDSTISLNASGVYYAEESRPGGLCPVKSNPITLTTIPVPVANAGPDQYVLENDLVKLNGSGGGLYAWTPVDSVSDATIANPTFTAKQNIKLVLTVTDNTGLCSSTDDVMIYVERPIFVVNTFTPNGDGVNDTWVIKNIESFPKCLVKIYNRWGSLVWESNSYPSPWDGTNFHNNQVLPDGTYFYIIELNSPIFKNPYQGWVQIIK